MTASQKAFHTVRLYGATWGLTGSTLRTFYRRMLYALTADYCQHKGEHFYASLGHAVVGILALDLELQEWRALPSLARKAR